MIVAQPGYTDSYYFTDVAIRLAHGQGLTADFIWSPLEAGALTLPVPSHLFWVPLPTVLAALGIALFAPFAGDFRAAQLIVIVVAALIPAAAYLAARSLGCGERMALVGAAIVGLGGLFAPGFVAVDAFAPAALIGTAFFLAFARAAAGSTRAGVLAGLLVGLLYLSRSEGAFFGVALVLLARTPHARRAGIAGSLVALAIGAAWFARDLSVGAGTGLFARSALLVRYEDLFAFQPEYLGTYTGPLGDLIGVRLAALLTNAATFVFAFALVLVIPLAAGLRALRGRADVNAWLGLALLVYVAQSLVWTLHSTPRFVFPFCGCLLPVRRRDRRGGCRAPAGGASAAQRVALDRGRGDPRGDHFVELRHAMGRDLQRGDPSASGRARCDPAGRIPGDRRRRLALALRPAGRGHAGRRPRSCGLRRREHERARDRARGGALQPLRRALPG